MTLFNLRFIGLIWVVIGGSSAIIALLTTNLSLRIHSETATNILSYEAKKIISWFDSFTKILIGALLSIVIGAIFRWDNATTVFYIICLFLFGGFLFFIAVWLVKGLLYEIFNISIFHQIKALPKQKNSDINSTIIPAISIILLQNEIVPPIFIVLLILTLVALMLWGRIQYKNIVNAGDEPSKSPDKK